MGKIEETTDFVESWDDWFDWCEERGLTVMPSWGADGWDAGNWPLVAFAVSWRQVDGRYVMRYAEYIEGDIRLFETRDLNGAVAHIDKMVAYWWTQNGTGPDDLELDPDGLPLNGAHRGMFDFAGYKPMRPDSSENMHHEH